MKIELLDQSAFDPTDPDESGLFILDVSIDEHVTFSIEGDFDEQPDYWQVSYAFVRIPGIVIEDILMESSVTEVMDSEQLEKILNLPVQRWTT